MGARFVALVSVAAAVAGATWWFWPHGDGTAQTDRQARALAQAIAYPRQPDAMGYARAILAKGGASVLEATDLKHTDPREPTAHLVIRIDYTACGKGNLYGCELVSKTVCYAFDINRYEPVDGPSVVGCPDRSPVTPPPLPRDEVPAADADALKAILAGLPPAPTAAEVTAALAALPAPPVDPTTKLAGVPPTVTSTVKGTDVGVALRGGDSVYGYDCVFGLRQGGKVSVWAPTRVQVQPGELSCAAAEAFSAYAQTPPH
jgi:hypothetical protein